MPLDAKTVNDIIDGIRTGILRLVVDDRILAEYRDVLRRERLRPWIAMEDAHDLLSFLSMSSERIVAAAIVRGLLDPGDTPFLEVAMTALVPLATGNTKHFPASKCSRHPVLTPTEFLRQMPTRGLSETRGK
jgi:predicted nucleic acid-binding protein